MKQEDKELLLKDLCARLPYMPKIKITYQQQGIKGTDEGNVSCDVIEKIVNDLRNDVITDMKIYLRPMSSMTKEEIKEYRAFHCVVGEHPYFYMQFCTVANELNMFDWLNKNHFDYRGLIEKGLALEAPIDMYMYKIDKV